LLAQGLLRVRGRPAVAYDQQGLVFAVAMEGGAIKLFDVRSYDKVSNSFDTARQCFCSIQSFQSFIAFVLCFPGSDSYFCFAHVHKLKDA
jgi:hypothetical protein